VLVTGATGFTGSRIVRILVERGHDVRCFVLPECRTTPLDGLPVSIARGDLARPDGLLAALDGVEALLSVASLGFGHGPGVVEACEREGVRRAVFFSTTAIFASLPTASKGVRLAAEEAIRDSALDWTILRPTMIYGAPGDRNVERLLSYFARHRIFPMAGWGTGLVQPVLVDDLAAAAVAALMEPRAVRRVYSLPGREPVEFRALVREAARAVGRRALLVPLPPIVLLALVRVHEALWARPRIKAEQILRLAEDKDFEWEAARRDLGYDPVGVREGLALEARRLGIGGGA
jgi:uncharacterized protein YbjT (DUF2867 family)